jgi:hypothetical protein
MLTLTIVLSACASAPTGAPPAQPTSPPAAAAPTLPPLPTSAAIAPPASGGVAIAPTLLAVTPTASAVTSGKTGAGWKRVEAANPPLARFDHTLTLDPASRKLVLYGGRDGSKTLGDTWVFDLTSSAWREVKSTPAPEARFGHAAAYDPKSKRVLIFAGQASGFFNDVWAFDAAKETWQKVEARGTPPVARYGTSAVVDTKRGLLIVSHGFASGRFDDTFALDLATNTWTQVQPVDGQPLKRCLHEAVYDAKSDEMILFGGCSSGFGPCPQGDLWSLDVSGKDWNEISPAGIKPSPRSNPALVGDDAGWLILFGGLTKDGPANDVWAFDIVTGEWTALEPPGNAPAARSSHDAAWDPATKQVIVFGGKGKGGALNDMWVLIP